MARSPNIRRPRDRVDRWCQHRLKIATSRVPSAQLAVGDDRGERPHVSPPGRAPAAVKGARSVSAKGQGVRRSDGGPPKRSQNKQAPTTHAHDR